MHANLTRTCVQAEVTFHSAPRSAGGSRSKWTRRWRGRRPAPTRWRAERHPPRTWSPRRGLPRPGPGQSSPANTSEGNELVCLPPEPEITSPLTTRNYRLQLRTWVCVFCLNPLRLWWRCDLSVPAYLYC
uniref:Uncharacterized protein n=1 Tax=Arundo donax TaxID=35708 RepID=A0A0A9D727_ARUDO